MKYMDWITTFKRIEDAIFDASLQDGEESDETSFKTALEQALGNFSLEELKRSVRDFHNTARSNIEHAQVVCDYLQNKFK